MPLEITACVTDADYEDWRRVRIAVIPYERTESLAELRAGDSPERLMLLAREDGVRRRPRPGRTAPTAPTLGSVIPRVLPEHRRRGIGTALLHRLADHVDSLGLPMVRGQRRRRGVAARSPSASASWRSTARSSRPSVVDRAARRHAAARRASRSSPRRSDPGLWEAALRALRPRGARRLRRRHPPRREPERWARDWLGDPMFLAAPRRRGRRLRRARPRHRRPRPAPRTPSPPYAATGAGVGSRSTSSSAPWPGPPTTA